MRIARTTGSPPSHLKMLELGAPTPNMWLAGHILLPPSTAARQTARSIRRACAAGGLGGQHGEPPKGNRVLGTNDQLNFLVVVCTVFVLINTCNNFT